MTRNPTNRYGLSLAVTLMLSLLAPLHLGADVLLDNMEGERSNVSTSGGFWMIILDANSHEAANTQLIFPPTLNAQFSPGGRESAKCARISGRIGAGYRSPFLGMGMNLDKSKHWHDLRKAERIEFWAKGKGVWNVKLKDAWNSRQTPSSAVFEYAFSVSPEWTLFSLPLRNFSPPIQSPAWRKGKSWEEVADSISTLLFMSKSYKSEDVFSTVELQVDDIVLRGVDKIGFSENNAPPRSKPDIRTVLDDSPDMNTDEEGMDRDHDDFE